MRAIIIKTNVNPCFCLIFLASSLDNLIRALNDHDNLEEQKRQASRDLADIYNLMVRLWGDGLNGY